MHQHSTNHVTIYGDFACPLSFLASRWADRLVGLGVDVEWRAVRDARPAGGRSRVVGMIATDGHPTSGCEAATGWLERALALPRAPIDTSMAVAAFAGRRGADAHELRRALFDAHWQQGCRLDDPAVLAELTGGSDDARPEVARRWLRAWQGFDQPALPLVLLRTGYVHRRAAAIQALGDLAEPPGRRVHRARSRRADHPSARPLDTARPYDRGG